MNHNDSRRKFLQTTALAGTALLIPDALWASKASQKDIDLQLYSARDDMKNASLVLYLHFWVVDNFIYKLPLRMAEFRKIYLHYLFCFGSHISANFYNSKTKSS